MTDLPTAEVAMPTQTNTAPLPHGGNFQPRGFTADAVPTAQEAAVTVENCTTDDQQDAATDDSTAGALHRAAAYVAEQGVTPEQAEALGIAARKVMADGDPDGAGRALADALVAHPALDCTDLAAVAAHMVGLANGIVHSARLATNPVISDPAYRVVPADGDDWVRYLHQAELAAHTARTTGGAGNPDKEFHQRRLLALAQAHAQYWGSGHGRTLQGEYAAQLADDAVFLATEAVTASLVSLPTNPHDIADRLHRAVDNAQGWHLAEVGDHSEAEAYASSRFHTATLAAQDAMRAASVPARMARALRTALDMVIAETGDTTPGRGPVEDVPEQPPKATIEDIAASLGAAIVEVDPAHRPDGLKDTDVRGWYQSDPAPALYFPVGQDPAERLAAARQIADRLKASE